MNQAHLHLLLNHLPVVGVLFGLLLAAVALVRKNEELRKISLWFFVGVALTALPAYFTGEPAEEIVEHLPGVSETMIEQHESAALAALVALEVVGALALAGLLFFRRVALPNWLMVSALALSLVSGALMARAANYGGQIRHSEIRADFNASATTDKTETESKQPKQKEEDEHQE